MTVIVEYQRISRAEIDVLYDVNRPIRERGRNVKPTVTAVQRRPNQSTSVRTQNACSEQVETPIATSDVGSKELGDRRAAPIDGLEAAIFPIVAHRKRLRMDRKQGAYECRCESCLLRCFSRDLHVRLPV